MKRLLLILISFVWVFMTASPVFGEVDELNTILLVNKDNLLDKQYEPKKLVDISDRVKCTKPNVLLCETAADAYVRMVAQMADDGIEDIAIVSGYRTYNYQSGLFSRKVNYYRKRSFSNENAEYHAALIVAPPGASEHQTGLAIDVSTKKNYYNLDYKIEKSDAFSWLKNNSYKFGFILRYDITKEDKTMITYEPWHFRYVGEEHAASIFEQNLCLEEYLELQAQ